MPHGGCELTFHFGDLYRNFFGATAFTEPRMALFGPNLSASLIQGTGRSQLASIRFTPNGFHQLFQIPIKVLTNLFLSADDFRQVSSRLSVEQILDAGFGNVIQSFDKFLTKQLPYASSQPSAIGYAVRYLQQLGSTPEIGALPCMINMSARTFELHFLKEVGFSAKRYAEIVRFNRVLWSLLQGKNSSLTELALKYNYYDQSHFIHSFHKITQLTPSEFLSRHKGGFFFK
jgi:AraC-like DNA-binding protein